MQQSKFFNHQIKDQLTVYDSFICSGDVYLSDLNSLSCIQIPSNISALDNGAFRKNQSIENAILHNNVSYIGRGAFFRCEFLESINLQDTIVNVVNERTFCKCSRLSNVVLPNSLSAIEDNAFAQSHLIQIQVPTLKKISNSAFADCEDLKDIMLDGNIAKSQISAEQFHTDLQLVHLDLPNISRIDDYCFSSRLDLSSITIPNSVSSIGSHAFLRCANLKYVKIPDSVVEIADSAFFECFNLVSVRIPNKVLTIEDDTFSDCYSLSDVQLNNVQSICNSAFRACISLKHIQLPDTLKKIDRSFYNCIALSSVNFPSSINYIGRGTFADCISLSSVDLSKCMISALNEEAFNGCISLSDIKLPKCLQLIKTECFKNCRNLSSINLDGIKFQHETFAGTQIKNLAGF